MQKKIQATTFTPIYDETEDRIRLVINYQDIQNRVDLMITRSFLLNLLPAAEEFVYKHYPTLSTQPQNSKETHNVQESKTATDGVNLELLKTEEELLTEVNFTLDANTNNTLVTFTSKNTTSSVLLTAELFEQTFNTIKSAIPFIKWGISHHF